MSKCGVSGRGRGWLNLQKNNQTVSLPGGDTFKSVPDSTKDEHDFDDVSEYKELLNRIKELNLADDGIKFNQKIKYILENWKQDCQTSEEVEKSFDALYKGCLNDDELASKLVIMVASRSFISQEVHDQNLRLIFVKKLQSDFETCKVLYKTNPTAFRNSVRMLGEFYNKARLANGQPFTFMVNPLLSYLEMLLESTRVLDLQQFTLQIYLNGSAIKAESSDKLIELFNKVRALLASDKNISREGKLWLLFSLEIFGNKFGVLPIDVYKFYQEQIGGNAMADFQLTQNTLKVQTPEDNKTLENYQSNVNVLQISTKSDLPAAAEPIASVLHNNSETNSSFTSTSGFVSDTSSHNSTNNTSRESTQSSGKYGRPILGAGARLHKNKNNDAGSNNWREKDVLSSGWGKSEEPGWRDRKPEKDSKSKSKTKGWEHDDRFENNYS